MATPVFTFQDICEFLWTTFNPAVKPPTGRELIAARNATIRAYRDVPQKHLWSYFVRHGIVSTSANQTSGLVVYDHTGGTNERMLTLSGATWPASADRGCVKIGGVIYDVEDYKTSSIVTLSASSNPGVDVSSTAYEWFRSSYPLPTNFRRILSIGETGSASDWYPIEYLSPMQFNEMTRADGGGTSSRPDFFTITNSGDYVGALEIVFGRAPNAARSYSFMYEINPRPLVTYKEASGSISVPAGSSSVTGSGTSFAAAHVGSVIRFTGSTSVEPTGIAGHVDGTTNPYLAQRIITAVADATHLTINSSLSDTNALSGTKFTISDPIDIEPIVMRSAFENACLAEYARLQKREDFKLLQSEAQRELIMAMGQDSRSLQPRSGTGEEGYRSSWGSVDVN